MLGTKRRARRSNWGNRITGKETGTPQRNKTRFLAALAGVLLLALLFVSYRARSFHYCASLGDRPQARVAGGDESCGPDEEPLELDRVGWPGKIRLAAQAAAKALGAK